MRPGGIYVAIIRRRFISDPLEDQYPLQQNKKAERILTPCKRNEEDIEVRKSQPIPSGIIQVGKLDPIIEVDEEEGLP